MPYKDSQKDREYRAAKRDEIRRVIDEAKNIPCSDCKIKFHLCVMQFDHVRGKKKFSMAAANGRAPTIKVLKEEIAKCDVVCANCHSVRTYERLTGRWAARKVFRGD